MRRIRRIEGTQLNAFDALLVEFGIDQSEEAVEAFLKSGKNQITPLSLDNMEDFRQGLNMILRADKTGAASKAAGSMVDALDDQVDATIRLMKRSGNPLGRNVVSNLRKARNTVKEMKREFSLESMAGRLIGKRKDGSNIIEASQVMRRFYLEPPERIRKTLSEMAKVGKQGRDAIGDIKAAMVLDALEKSLKAPSRKDAGLEIVGGYQFAKHFEQRIGMDRLRVLFRGDREGLRKVQELIQVAKDIEPPAGATVKGSGQQILDMLNIVGNAPGMAAIAKPLAIVVNAGSEARAVRRAIRAAPAKLREVNRMLEQLRPAYPTLAAALTTMLLGEDEE